MMQNYLSLGILLILYIEVSVGQGIFQFSCRNETTYCIRDSTCRTCPRIRPFCNSERRECVANPSPTDNCPSGMNGAVPSLDSCTSYVECLAGEARRINCQLGSVFDPASGICQRGKPCYRFNCLAREGTYVSYQGDPRLYAFCSGGMAVGLLSCPPGTQYVQGEGCQFVCPGVGSFIDYSSCQRFYRCIQIGATLISIPANCGANQIFSPDVGACIIAAADSTQRRVLCSASQTTL